MSVKIVVLAVLALVYLYGMVLRLFKRRSEHAPVPANVSDVYDAETYNKWRAYHAEKSRLGMWDSTAGFAVDFGTSRRRPSWRAG